MSVKKEALGYLKKYKASIDFVTNTKAFENYDLYIAQVIENNYPQETELNRKTTNSLSKKLISLKNRIMKDINTGQECQNKALTYQEKPEHKSEMSEFIKYFYKLMCESKIDVKANLGTGDTLVNYFNEQETLQDSLKSVKQVADSMAATNRNASFELSKAKTELKITKENLDRKSKKCDKLKLIITEYRHNTMQLAHTVEADLKRLHGMDLDEIPNYIKLLSSDVNKLKNNDDDYISQLDAQKSPGKTSKVSAEKENLWFDIEKSQVRYETMLDSYMNIIKDKDEYIKKAESDLLNLKKDRLDVEDAHFNQIREKDRLLSESEALRNDLNNKLTSTNAKVKGLEIELEELCKKVTDKNTDLEEKYSDQINEFAKVAESEINLKKQLSELIDELDKTQKDLLDARVKICEYEDDQELKIRISELEGENAVLEEKKLDQRTKLIELEKEIPSQRNQIKDKENKLLDAADETIQQKNGSAKLLRELTDLKIAYKDLTTQDIELKIILNILTKSEAEAKKTYETRDYEAKALEMQQKDDQKTIKEQDNDVRQLEKKCSLLAKEVDNYRFGVGQPGNSNNQSFDNNQKKSKTGTPHVKNKSYAKMEKENVYEDSPSLRQEQDYEQPIQKNTSNVLTIKSNNSNADTSNMPKNEHVPTGGQAFNYISFSNTKKYESNEFVQDEPVKLKVDESQPQPKRENQAIDFTIKHFGNSPDLRQDETYELVKELHTLKRKEIYSPSRTEAIPEGTSRKEYSPEKVIEDKSSPILEKENIDTEAPTIDFEPVVCPEEPEEQSFSDINKADTERYDIEENIETVQVDGTTTSYAFIKCTSQTKVSDEITRKQNTLIIQDSLKNVKKMLDFTQIFTQFDLDRLDKDFHSLFSEAKKTYILLYGMPLNIKLFIFHKSVACFISRIFHSVSPNNTSLKLNIIFNCKMIDIIVSKISKQGEHFISPSEYSHEKLAEYSLFSKFVLKPKSREAVDRFKAVCFSQIAGEFAYMLNFISLEGFDNDVSKGNLFVSRSQVNKVRQDAEEVGELIDELLFATNRNDPENIEMSEFMEELDILVYDKMFFLILEPSKISQFEEVKNLLEIHAKLENKI